MFYNMENDGLSVDDKRTPVEENDIPDILEQFKKDEKPTDRKSKCFVVPVKEIKETDDLNLNFSEYQEIVFEEVKYEDPKKLLKGISENEDNIKKGVDEIKRLLR